MSDKGVIPGCPDFSISDTPKQSLHIIHRDIEGPRPLLKKNDQLHISPFIESIDSPLNMRTFETEEDDEEPMKEVSVIVQNPEKIYKMSA